MLVVCIPIKHYNDSFSCWLGEMSEIAPEARREVCSVSVVLCRLILVLG